MADQDRQTCAKCLRSLPQDDNFSGSDLNNVEGKCNACKQKAKAAVAPAPAQDAVTGWSKLHEGHELSWTFASDHKRFACAKCTKFHDGKSWYCAQCKFNLCRGCFEASKSDAAFAETPARSALFFAPSFGSDNPNRAQYHSIDPISRPSPPAAQQQQSPSGRHDAPAPRLPASKLRSTPLERGQPGWVPDGSVRRCHQCRKMFSLMLRKHHCRWCGLIFCSHCSNNFWGPAGSEGTIRSCDACFKIKEEEEPRPKAKFGRDVADDDY